MDFSDNLIFSNEQDCIHYTLFNERLSGLRDGSVDSLKGGLCGQTKRKQLLIG